MTQVRVAVAAVVVLMATAITTTGTAMQAAPCSAPLPTPPPPGTPPKPAAPTGLRILSGGGDALLDLEQISGPNAEVDGETTTVSAPATAAGNAYFDELVRRTDCLAAYSLRLQAEIDKYRHAGEVKVNYDPVMDAAKWSWIRDDESADNIRMPIYLARPATGSSKLLIISDHRWDSAWFTEFKDPRGVPISGWKWMQVTSSKSETDPKQQIWFEPQMRGLGDNDWMKDTPPVLSLFGARGYFGIVPPTMNERVLNPCPRPIDMGDQTLGPMLNCFRAYANTWTRVWIELTMTAGTAHTSISWWMADENQAPVQILKDAQMYSYGAHTEFWYEYDTSRAERLGGPMAAWGRNVIVLKNVANPSSLLQKPIR